MNDITFQTAKERVNGTKPGRDYYVHLLVGITETRHCLATLREYVLSVWQDGDLSDNELSAQRLSMKLIEQFGLHQQTPQQHQQTHQQHQQHQQTRQDDTLLVSDCLQSLKHKVTAWEEEMQQLSGSRLQKVISEDKKNVNYMNNNNSIINKINKYLQKKDKNESNETISNNDNTTLPPIKLNDAGDINENKNDDDLQRQVKDLISQLESQDEQINSLLRANQNYKDDYRNKLKSLNRSMASKMAAMNRRVMEAMDENSCDKNGSNKYDHLLRRVTALNSQLSEKKREVQTLKNVVNYNRCNSDYQLKKLQDEFDEYKETSQLSNSSYTANPSFYEDNWKEMNGLQTTLVKLEQENTNLRHLLSLEVTEKLKILDHQFNGKPLDRRHSLPGRVMNDISPDNHMRPIRRLQTVNLA